MEADHIRIMCPSLTCRKILAVPASSRGRNVRCRSCSATIRVPEKSTKPDAAQPPADGPGKAKAA